MKTPTSLLLRYLTIAYSGLIVYASLHPFSGWQSPGISPFIFLDAAWPRYWTGFDFAVNIGAYIPFGFLYAQLLSERLRRPAASLLATLLGVVLSFAMESAQSYLPSRIPSNIDLLSNSLGAALGTLVSALYGRHFMACLWHVRQFILAPVPHVEYGLILIALWLLTQLSPETLLFGTGDLRQLFDITPAWPYAAPSFFAQETVLIICNAIAVGMVASLVFTHKSSTYLAMFWLFAAAIVVRCLATAILVAPQSALAWLTPGAGLGLLFGGLILALLLLLPQPWRIAIAALALMAGTVLVNIAPFNPYSAAALVAWRQGHFLNFNGLTRLAASLWPFLSIVYLILLGRRQ